MKPSCLGQVDSRITPILAQQGLALFMSFISYVSGDLFSAPAGSILVHACNTKGSWGAGIALAFKQRFPDAFKVYRAHCQENGDSLAGTCLIIDGGSHYIACLFTSRAYGRNKDSPEQILTATDSALRDLMAQNTDANLELHAW
jgi:ADP-ribose 1''-phosphate phosphatase